MANLLKSKIYTTNDPLRIPVSRPLDPIRTGFLNKRGDVLDNRFKRRWFMLSKHYLYYYKNQDSPKFNGAIQLLFSSIKVLKPEEVMGESWCFKIITPQRVFILQASSKPELEDWLNSIQKTCQELWEEENRITKEKHEDLVNKDVIHKGWLSKQGHNLLKDWRDRYFVLKKDTLYYFKTDKDYRPLGSLSLLQCSLKPSQTRKMSFEIVTPVTTIAVCAKEIGEYTNWMKFIQQQIIETLEVNFEKEKSGATTKPSRNSANASEKAALLTSEGLVPTPNGAPKPQQPASPTGKVDHTIAPPVSEGVKIISSAVTRSVHPKLQKCLDLPENRVCAECSTKEPKWASINLGCFLCIECSGIHRSLGVHLSKVRSVDLDQWEDENLDYMAVMGNQRTNAIWEAEIVSPYVKPNSTTPRATKAEFILAKYEQKLFADPDFLLALTIDEIEKQMANERRPTHTASSFFTKSQKAVFAPAKEGFLTKLNPKDANVKSWKRRWFVLKDNCLYYYITREDVLPTGLIKLEGAKVRVSDVNKQHCFEVVTSQREWVLQAEDSSDMSLWMEIISKSVQLFVSGAQISEPQQQPGQKTRRTVALKEAYVKHKGFLMKQGHNFVKDWRQRWFVLYKNALYYYENDEDDLPLGIIEIDKEVEIAKSQNAKKKFQVDITTAGGRVYSMTHERENVIDEWVKQLKEAMV